jgi:hypothetical protein
MAYLLYTERAPNEDRRVQRARPLDELFDLLDS